VKNLLTAAIALLALALTAGSAHAQTASAELTWVPPTQNEDGSALTDLRGYRIRYGCEQSGSYTETVQLNDATLTSYVVQGLPAPGTCYFVLTAYNSAGIESRYSNEASKAFVARPNPPSMLSVLQDGTIAFTVFTVENQLLLVEVGRVAPGVQCDSEQFVQAGGPFPNGEKRLLHMVPVQQVELLPSVPRSSELAVFAECGI